MSYRAICNVLREKLRSNLNGRLLDKIYTSQHILVLSTTNAKCKIGLHQDNNHMWLKVHSPYMQISQPNDRRRGIELPIPVPIDNVLVDHIRESSVSEQYMRSRVRRAKMLISSMNIGEFEYDKDGSLVEQCHGDNINICVQLVSDKNKYDLYLQYPQITCLEKIVSDVVLYKE